MASYQMCCFHNRVVMNLRAITLFVLSMLLCFCVTNVLSQEIGSKEYYDKAGPFQCSSPERVTVPHDSEYKNDSRTSGGMYNFDLQ